MHDDLGDDLWTLPTLTVRALHVGPMDNVAYLLTCPVTGTQALVDAAAEPERLLALVAAHGTGRLETVVTTHRHPDHVGALAAVVAATGARVATGAEDADAVTEATGCPVDLRLGHADRFVLGGALLEIVALRGHTPGSVALVHGSPTAPAVPGHRPDAPQDVPGGVVVLTGDSLFPGGVGNTQHDQARFTALLTDVRERLFAPYPDALVLPGHGAPTTLATERPHLDTWEQRGW
ncbi:glyoxylase-like metal-dependent hydrolase (beta-lactamase superfamily II) [Luteimicrobium subarcticum]|uniref:Glyoxylase-like metal-dependent hydrolase (Beta-lactamase superfamily II) n=1 Tax=Luteimicrobium subarcticum TaxID=620910 RepID=A0A2M8W3D5_9MICO|nr:glyoxylase-like metal-dependent hydrolase (beta-lactamase superfamily II) [Luteimicrobium subarcticum]